MTAWSLAGILIPSLQPGKAVYDIPMCYQCLAKGQALVADSR